MMWPADSYRCDFIVLTLQVLQEAFLREALALGDLGHDIALLGQTARCKIRDV